MSGDGNNFFPETEALGVGRLDGAVPTIDETASRPIVGRSSDDGRGPRPGYLGVAVSGRRLALYFAVFGLMFATLFVRAAELSLLQGDRYRRLAEGNRLRLAPIPADRGVIHDRNGRLLVRNVPDFTLTVTPADFPKDGPARADLLVRLAEIADLTPVDIERILQRYPATLASPVPIKEHLEYKKALLLDVRSGVLPGVDVAVGTKREYLLDNPEKPGTAILSLSHVLGYEGRVNEDEYAGLKSEGYQPADSIGRAGIEASYESALRGSYGKKQIEVDALGREQSVLAQNNAVQGKDLTLSIDTGLQAAAEKSLRQSAAVNGRGRGVAVAMDPKTGEILALVSWPAFDSNIFARGISIDDYKALVESSDQPMFPRAISGLYPPGSTVKLIIAAAALAEKVITPRTTVLSTGGIKFGQWFFPDWKAGGHGVTNVTKAIADSVNTFFYAVGGGWDNITGLGVGRLTSWFAKFGLGKKLGVDLPGERDGFLPSEAWKQQAKKQPWFIGDTYHLSIGQGDLLVTPLQVAAWTSVYANRGDLMLPHVVKAVGSGANENPAAPVILKKQIVSPEVIETVRQGMRQTVLTGSAQSLQASPWAIAGKTGTAQWKQGAPNHAWFTGFAPYDDPKIVVTVLIEAGGEGSHSAVPVARDIMEAWLRKQKVPGRNGFIQSATASAERFLD